MIEKHYLRLVLLVNALTINWSHSMCKWRKRSISNCVPPWLKTRNRINKASFCINCKLFSFRSISDLRKVASNDGQTKRCKLLGRLRAALGRGQLTNWWLLASCGNNWQVNILSVCPNYSLVGKNTAYLVIKENYENECNYNRLGKKFLDIHNKADTKATNYVYV